jgi:Ca2+-binding RTX toxin-like protein
MTAPTLSFNTTYAPDSGKTNIDALLAGMKWGGSLGTSVSLTYSFPWQNGLTATFSGYNGQPYSSLGENTASERYGFNSTQISAATGALVTWTNVANIELKQITETSTNVGDIRFAITSATDTVSTGGMAWGWAGYPNSYWPSAGDIWVSTSSTGISNTNWSVGSYNYYSLIHEIGHALGLKHPFSSTPVLPTNLDSRLYSVMSYTNATTSLFVQVTSNADGSVSLSSFNVVPETPMLLDIAAIQYLYGANNSYKTGDDVYTFDTRTPFYKTIWDAGGIDTISVSNFTEGCLINLNAGSFSSITIKSDSTAGYIWKNPPATPTYDGTNNLCIAYDVVIEKAIGGYGNDTLIGNSANNSLDGGPGNDTIYGGDGHDIFDWDSTKRDGNDFFYGGNGNDTYVLDSVNDVVIEDFNQGADLIYVDFSYSIATINNVERLYGYGTNNLNLVGNSLDNYIKGNTGNDTLDGGLGSDYAVYTSELYSNCTITFNGVTYTCKTLAQGTDTLKNIEFIVFSDKTINLSNLSGITDTTPPTISISSSTTSLGVGQTAVITFSLSESSINFTVSDVSVTGGTLSNFSGSGTSYSATFTPTTNSTNNGVIKVASGAFTDAAGNANTDGSEVNNTITLSVNTVSDDFAASAATTGRLAVGASISGSIETLGDKDWFAITLTAGVSYKFSLTSPIVGLGDPMLRLYAASGTLITSDDDSGPGLDSEINYTAATNGVFYLEVLNSTIAIGNTKTGIYTLTAVDVSSPSYSISSSATTVDEGSTAQFILTTKNVAAGTAVSYSISGVSAADLQSGQTTGTATISSNGTTFINVPVAADGITEGSETLTIRVQGQTSSILINDTSNALNKPPTGSVLISGSAQQNQVLTATNSIKDLDGLGSISYFWMVSQDNKNWIDLATGTSITLKEEHVGKYIFAYAAYTDGKGKLETVASASTAVVSNVNDLPVGNVNVDGIPKSGQTLTVSNSLADLDGLGSITYTWQSSTDGTNWAAFSTGNSVKLNDAQAGKFIRATAQYTDGHGTFESVLSEKTVPVTYADTGNLTTSYNFQNYDAAAPSNTNSGFSTTTSLSGWNNILRTANNFVNTVDAGTVKSQFTNADGSISLNLSTGSIKFNGVTLTGNSMSITSKVITNLDGSSKVTLVGSITIDSANPSGTGTYSSITYESGLNTGSPFGYTLVGSIVDSPLALGGNATELVYYTKNNTNNYTTTTKYNLTNASVGWDYTNSSYILSSSTSVSNLSTSTKDANGNLTASLNLNNSKTVTANTTNLFWLFMGGDDKIILSGDGDRTSASGFGGNDYIIGDSGNNYFNNKVEGATFNFSGLGDDTIDGGSGYDIVFFGSNKSIGSYDFSNFDPLKRAITLIDGSSNDNTGKDTAINIEQFQFNDATIEFTQFEKMFNPTNATGVGFGLLDFGTSTGDQINGTSKNDAIDGLGGNDLLNGLSGNDLIWGGAGNDSIDGGLGVDTAYYFNPSSNFKLSFSGDKVTLTDNLSWEGTDTLSNIERLNFSNRDVIIETKSHVSYQALPSELYQFFITAFNAAPGVSYMDQLAEAYNYGLSVKQIVDIFTTKKQFTDVYSPSLSHLDLATQLVTNIVKNSASTSVKSGAITDIKGALELGWTVGEVIYTVFGNLAQKSFTDSDWGNTAKQFSNEIKVAKYYTEVLNQSTTDLETLRDVIQPVTQSTDVSSDVAIAQLIGVALMTGGLGPGP